MRFSRRTLASLARVISEYNSNVDIDALAYEFGKEDVAIGSSKIAKCINFVKNLEKECEEIGEDRPIIEVIERTLSLYNERDVENPELVSGLLASLRVDGFHFSNGVIIPTTPEPASLGPILSQLEQDLLNDDDTVFAYQVGVGVGYAVNEKVTIDVKYRYFATSDPEFDTTEAEFASHNFLFGVRVNF